MIQNKFTTSFTIKKWVLNKTINSEDSLEWTQEQSFLRKLINIAAKTEIRTIPSEELTLDNNLKVVK